MPSQIQVNLSYKIDLLTSYTGFESNGKHVQAGCNEQKVDVFLEYVKERQKPRRTDNINSFNENTTNFNKSNSRLMFGDGLYDPAAKLLTICIRWLHSIDSFVQIKPTEQSTLLNNNWKELYIITAAQYSFFFDEGKNSTYLVKKIVNQT